MTLPLALADLGLIDEYEFLVQPVLAGHGPTLLAGLRERNQLELVDRREFSSGAVALRYLPARASLGGMTDADREQGQGVSRADEPADALWSRLRLVEGQPLADRADAYSALHGELMKRLDGDR